MYDTFSFNIYTHNTRSFNMKAFTAKYFICYYHYCVSIYQNITSKLSFNCFWLFYCSSAYKYWYYKYLFWSFQRNLAWPLLGVRGTLSGNMTQNDLNFRNSGHFKGNKLYFCTFTGQRMAWNYFYGVWWIFLIF